jgi:hypothetical protein
MTVVPSNYEYGALQQFIVHRGSSRLSPGSRVSPLAAWPGGDYVLGIRRADTLSPAPVRQTSHPTETLLPRALSFVLGVVF